MFNSFHTPINGFFLYGLFFILFLLLILFIVMVRKLWHRHRHRLIPDTPVYEQLIALNQELAPTGFSYELPQDVFTTLMDCWQREFGYCRFYDEAAARLSMIIDCEPICFDYGGKKWLIELWKGQYGMNTGAEIGIYNTNLDSDKDMGFFEGTMFQSVDDAERLYMSFVLKKNNEVLFTKNGLHWWLTGFKLGLFSNPSELTMDIRISFPNRSMCNAFAEALYKIGYTTDDVLIRYHTVFFTYDTPHNPQPSSRTSVTEYLVQKTNNLYCSTYAYLTKDYHTTLDKLEYLRIYSPKLYRTILNVGKDKNLFHYFSVLNFIGDRRR